VQLDILPGCYVKRLALRISADNISYFAPLQPTDAPAEDSYTLQKQTLLPLRVYAEYALRTERRRLLTLAIAIGCLLAHRIHSFTFPVIVS
jgi:hypothetical protein